MLCEPEVVIVIEVPGAVLLVVKVAEKVIRLAALSSFQGVIS